jgi:dUTP pyrophosphatase
MTCFLEIEELVEGCFPKFAYEDDACFDLVAAEGLLLNVGRVAKVRTGIKMGIPKGFEVQIRPRSGMALKHAITVVNSPGTIDSGYQGEVMVLLMKLGSGTKDKNYVSGDPFDCYYVINKGDRIAQACIKPVYDTVLQRVEAIKFTGRDGLGHTGK